MYVTPAVVSPARTSPPLSPRTSPASASSAAARIAITTAPRIHSAPVTIARSSGLRSARRASCAGRAFAAREPPQGAPLEHEADHRADRDRGHPVDRADQADHDPLVMRRAGVQRDEQQRDDNAAGDVREHDQAGDAAERAPHERQPGRIALGHLCAHARVHG